jgi:hypothetical protein
MLVGNCRRGAFGGLCSASAIVLRTKDGSPGSERGVVEALEMSSKLHIMIAAALLDFEPLKSGRHDVSETSA